MSWVLLGKGTSQVNRYTPWCCVGLFFLALLLLEKEMELLWCDLFNFFPQKHHVLDKSMVMIVSMWAREVAIEGKTGWCSRWGHAGVPVFSFTGYLSYQWKENRFDCIWQLLSTNRICERRACSRLNSQLFPAVRSKIKQRLQYPMQLAFILTYF